MNLYLPKRSRPFRWKKPYKDPFPVVRLQSYQSTTLGIFKLINSMLAPMPEPTPKERTLLDEIYRIARQPQRRSINLPLGATIKEG
jgi:hypothetical protein